MKVQTFHARHALFFPLIISGVLYSSPTLAECDESFLRANAIFIRATVLCGKNYMDSPAGYYALAMSRKCTELGDQKLESLIKNAMLEFDSVMKKHGKKRACLWADEIENSVNADRPN